MEFTKEQRKNLRDAIVDTLDEAELTMLLEDELDVSLNNISEKQEFPLMVRKVVVYMRKRYRLVEFVQALHRCREHVPVFQDLVREIWDRVPGAVTISGKLNVIQATGSRFPLQPHDFDLSSLVTKSREYLRKRRGVVGLRLVSDHQAVLEALCKRLEIELPTQRGSMHCLAVQSIRGLEEIPFLVKTIKRYQELLSIQDVLFPIMLPFPHIPSAIERIWEPAVAHYGDRLARRLILVFAGDNTVGCPQSIHDLPLDPFGAGHVDEWISRTIQFMEWQPTLRDRWVDQILDHCQSSGEANEIRPELLYPHLDSICKLLQSQMTADALLDTLYKEF